MIWSTVIGSTIWINVILFTDQLVPLRQCHRACPAFRASRAACANSFADCVWFLIVWRITQWVFPWKMKISPQRDSSHPKKEKNLNMAVGQNLKKPWSVDIQKTLGFMDVHPLKDGLVGIDPYPWKSVWLSSIQLTVLPGPPNLAQFFRMKDEGWSRNMAWNSFLKKHLHQMSAWIDHRCHRYPEIMFRDWSNIPQATSQECHWEWLTMAGVSFCNKRVRNWLRKISKNVTVDQLSNAKDVANVGNPIINLPFGGWFIPPMKKWWFWGYFGNGLALWADAAVLSLVAHYGIVHPSGSHVTTNDLYRAAATRQHGNGNATHGCHVTHGCQP